MKVGILRFPGTNCDRDVAAMVQAKDYKHDYLWHLDQFETKAYDLLVLPGGFSYGDYLRSGALAAKSPVMKSVREFAERGGPILGICNGFQILCEAGLLRGALLKNVHRRFNDKWVTLEVCGTSYFLKDEKRKHLRLPVAHGDGRYFAEEDTIKNLQDKNLIWLKYEENPNGSLHNIAGVMSENRKVAALMPHPERAIFDWMGSSDGWSFL